MEQHALNGNIDAINRVDDKQGDYEALGEHLRAQFWDAPPIEGQDVHLPNVQARQAENNLATVLYSDPDGAMSYYSIAGTQHQLFGNKRNIGPLIRVWSDQGDEVLIPPENAWGDANDLPQGETLPQAFIRTTKHIQWTGVGYDQAYNHGALSLTEVGMKMADAVSHPDPTTPNILNPQRANVVSGFVQGAPVFGLMAQSAMATHID